MDEGYIKFNCNWIKDKPVSPEDISEINFWRDRLYSIGLIGVYENGIGFGNISIRFGNQEFLITGSATGGVERLNNGHYVVVNKYDLLQNSLICTGPIKASSESLSHAVIYECSPNTNAVIHIHHLKLWQQLLDVLPTTCDKVAYGTPEMAEEIKRLFVETAVKKEKAIVMGGHEEGIITFGETLDEAGEILLNLYKKLTEIKQ
jgi:ribulose-5-phosphate 4-epimerase/fuculose-1-phosphate aldolase